MRKRLILYAPHEAQLKFHESTKRFRIFCSGRQAGKSTACLNEILFKAWQKLGVYWFISPTYSQAKEQYRRIKRLCPFDVIAKRNETELRIDLINESAIEFRSGETRDNLRGATLDGVVIDEVRDQYPDDWPLLIRPMLTTTKGWAVFASTPSGFDHFYDLAERSKSDSDWELFTAPSMANPLFTQDEFEAAKRSMSEPQFAQEILAEFRDLTSGKVYHAFGDHNDMRTSPFAPSRIWSPYLPLIIGMDFNLNPMHWTIGQTAGGRWHWFDEVHLENSHTLAAAFVLRDKILAMRQAGHSADNPMVILLGDATGKATQRTSNQSDYDIVKEVLRDAQIKFSDDTPESNPSIKDRVNAVNAKCRNARGETEMFVNFETCPKLVHDFQRVVWKVGKDIALNPGQKMELTHATDSIGYAIHAMTPIKGVTDVSQRIIQRVL